MEEKADALKELVLRCRRTGEGRRELLEELARRAYGFAGRRRGAGEDEPGEFLLFMYPRLERLVDRYRDAGVPFEHYLNSVLGWNLRSFRRHARAAEMRWRAGITADFWQPQVEQGRAQDEGEGEDEGDPQPCPLPFVPRLRRPAERKRFLLLVLRECWRLGPRRLEQAARIARVSAPWLAAVAAALRATLAPRLRRLERLRGRRDAAWAGMRLLQEQRAHAGDPRESERLERAITRYAICWRRACDLITKVPLEPTHRRIASELGMPRGTVDTCLRAARGLRLVATNSLRQREMELRTPQTLLADRKPA
jgi:hypothetical protein